MASTQDASMQEGEPLEREPDLPDRGDKLEDLERAAQELRLEGKGAKAEHAPHGQAQHEPAVRFASQLQEIEPQTTTGESSYAESPGITPLSPEAQAELKSLSMSLQTSHLQHRRLTDAAFEPVSLPVSRVPSPESRSRQGSSAASQRTGTSSASMQTPPLTPSASGGKEHVPPPRLPGHMQMTPQATGSGSQLSSGPPSRSPRLSGSPDVQNQTQVPKFTVSSGYGSLPASREPSPSRSSRPGSGTSTPTPQYTRPFTPAGRADDPYSRTKRGPINRNPDTIDDRFKFGSKDSKRSSSYMGSSQSFPRVADKRESAIRQEEAHGHKGHSSMADLKRFFRFGHSSPKRAHSPAPSAVGSARQSHASSRSGTSTPPTRTAAPFADDHGLESKYGKFGKVLGSGAGGSVRLLKRGSDGVTFAVKQFREKHSYESHKEYAKKVTAEFCIGSTLHHGNIIETLDIVQEKGRWYEVMEFAPFDLFATVMTGKMSREEVSCTFLQIFAGVTYLHSMGLAHRDMKLDNVVINEHGIMKIIDFGSATVYRYPFETGIVLATGIVGSDPYLAPEVYDNSRYDPQPTDIWSLAIIFACMSLRRFPWKVPRLTDNSFRLFVATPAPGTTPMTPTDRKPSETRPVSMYAAPPSSEQKAAEATEQKPPGQGAEDGRPHSSHHHHHHHKHEEGEKSENGRTETPSSGTTSGAVPAKAVPAEAAKQQEVIKGPWRLLRLLPRESRSAISRMLELDPKKRITIEELLQDPWITNTPVCRQLDHGQIIKATGHTHHLEPGSSEPAPPK